MIIKLRLKNSDKTVLMDQNVYDELSSRSYYKEINLFDNLREHSSGCAVFQKSWRKADGSYKVETIYLHKLIAENFIENDDPDEASYVMAINGDKLDCRVKNLRWVNRSVIIRRSAAYGKSGFRGVNVENNRFRAVIYDNYRRINVGLFDTAEEAAAAYRVKVKELFGEDVKVTKSAPNKRTRSKK